MKYRYLLFDLDGTLTNPEEGITKSFAYALEKLGMPSESREALRKVIGPPLVQSFEEFFGITGERAEQGIQWYRERYSALGWKENKVYDGIDEMLRKLKEQGYSMILATSKPEPFANKIMELFHLEQYFTMLCGADDYSSNRRTKEEIVRYALEQNHITDVNEVLMIGDRKYDVIGAGALGIRTVGVLYGFGSEEELLAAGAIHLVNTPQELVEYLGRLTKVTDAKAF